eukprot:Seg63.3 transcript_id=Seg63.3/GoldUCD/mRNA.D3Y31 product="hypothetical protein" protein_id=Seg63.3/GoldUCD/D3Y31
MSAEEKSVIHEEKGDGKLTICGLAIYRRHEAMCIAYFDAKRKREGKASEGSENRSLKWMQLHRQEANSFLKKKKFQDVRKLFDKRSSANATVSTPTRANVVEECCIEGCVMEELREYPCH